VARKKKMEESENSVTHIDPNFEDVQLELEPEDQQSSYKKNKTKPKTAKTTERGSFAPFALTLGLMMIGALVFSIFYRPVSSSLVAPKINESLRIFLSITTSEFATEGSASGSLDICKGTKEFPGIDRATVFVKDTNEKEIGLISVKEAASKNNSTCLYELTLKPVPDFPGTKLNVFVRFPFGDSNTFLVDVGSQAPYKKINIRLTLG
jgi:hypothetical protein